MQIDTNRIDNVLAEEEQIYDELVCTCSEARSSILQGDIDGLARITRRQNRLIVGATEIGRERAALQKELQVAPEQGGKAQSESATPLMTEPYAAKFAEHDTRLGSSVEKLREHSEHNRSLLAFSLQMVDDAMRSLCDDDPLPYQSSGATAGSSSSNSGLLDREA